LQTFEAKREYGVKGLHNNYAYWVTRRLGAEFEGTGKNSADQNF